MNNIEEIAKKINEHLKSIPTKQQRNPYIWDYTIKIKTKDDKYDYEEETKEKVKVKRLKDERR